MIMVVDYASITINRFLSRKVYKIFMHLA